MPKNQTLPDKPQSQPRSTKDPRYQPTQKPPRGTTVTPPLPRGGGINRGTGKE